MMGAMSTLQTHREFIPGTTGWTVDDLDDPEIDRLWEAGAYEIVEGVLTLMPPACHDGTLPLSRLRRIIERHLDLSKMPGEFSGEDDFIVGRKKVARVDLMFMTPDDHRRQEEANRAKGNPRLRFGRIRVAPTLIVESTSLGHEDHDVETKRVWYAEAGVPNYWILNAFERSMECLKLVDGAYQIDVAARETQPIQPSLFPGLIIQLAELWA
jgi:Uma2 family endonuclease